MTIDDICLMTTRVSTLNALHACREGHAWNNEHQWRNAWAAACQDKNVSIRAISWPDIEGNSAMKLRVQAQHLQAGDIVGSGEVVLSIHPGMHKKVDVRLHNPNRAVIVAYDPNRCDRVSSWGKYTLIGIERAEKVEK